MLTCAMKNCPAAATRLNHYQKNIYEKGDRKWGFMDSGFNCKYVVGADSKILNGKIIFEIQSTKNIELFIYLQPN